MGKVSQVFLPSIGLPPQSRLDEVLGLPHQLESNECPDSDGVGAPFGLLFRRRIVDIFGCKPYDPFDVFVRNVPDFVLIEADCDRVAVCYEYVRWYSIW